MMNKKQKQLLNATLDKALAPPRKRSHLDSLLNEYDDGSRLSSSQPLTYEKPPALESLSAPNRLVSAPEIISAPDRLLSAPEKFSAAEKIDCQPLNVSGADSYQSGAEIISGADSLSAPEQHLRIPNEILDRIFPTLLPSDQIVMLRLYRLTRGFHNDNIKVSMKKLANACNLSGRQVTTCVRRLEQRGLIKKLSVDWSNKNQADRGVVIQMLLPGVPREIRVAPEIISAPDRLLSAPEIISPIKYKYINTTHTQTETRVRVASRFSLEECRRYANHLKATGQGITNPGGYATKIFRSGEADALIETFLNSSSPLDLSQCPDCRGSNFIYIDPANRDKGVRPCKHGRLKQS